MNYVVESSKSFAEVVFDLEPVVQRLGFTVLQTCDLGETLLRKGVAFDEECQVFDLLSYRYAGKLLAGDMRLALSLPWRITVFTENSATKIGLVRPQVFLAESSADSELAQIIGEIEAKLVLIVDEVR